MKNSISLLIMNEQTKSCLKTREIRFLVLDICMILLFTISSANKLYSQRLFIGVGADVMATHYTHFYKDFFFSENTYKGFYLNQNQMNFDAKFGNFRLILLVSYNRFTISTEFSELIFHNLFYRLDYPLYNNNQELVYANYLSLIRYEETTLSPVLGYSYYRGSNFNLFAETAVTFVWPKGAEEDLSLGGFFRDNGSYGYYFTTNVLFKEMDLDKAGMKYMLGTGIRNSKYSFALRYFWRLNKTADMPNLFSYLCFSLTTYTGFSYLKKNKIYFE